jgi:UDP-N-acetylglucosamine 2-epimerase (non-hydrolysing)
LSSPSILLVVGTRPEAIKLAPLFDSLRARGLPARLALTGQHSQLDPASFGLPREGVVRLHCPAGKDPQGHAADVADALQPLLLGPGRPRLLVVQGDTSSALGGALGAEAAQVPLAHVEAGLRSFDLAFPWPEEGNRIAIDTRSTLLFAPTEENAANLLAEGVRGAIHVTGNTAVDALFRVLRALPPRLPGAGGIPRLLVTCHRRENWGAAFTPIGLALLDLARSPFLRIEFVLPSNPDMARAASLLLAGHPRLRLLGPMCHAGMVATLRSASLVLSDSGGIQEEAPALGIPLLVLRGRTERPEGIASGNSCLVGSERQAIVAAVCRLLADRAAYAAMATPALPFGDGQAAERIAAHVADWLATREGSREVQFA